jgi:ABC-type polysaccharide/polyol phosphate export permease
VTGIIEGYRSALLGLPVNGSAAAVSLALTVLLLLLSARYFRSVERTFADVV